VQAPTTQGLQAPPVSQTSPCGQGQLVPPQLSRQLVASGQDGTQLGVFAPPPHPNSATAPARTTAGGTRDLLFAPNPQSADEKMTSPASRSLLGAAARRRARAAVS
jgi:hypothetical protein